jgi:hypothetical protein
LKANPFPSLLREAVAEFRAQTFREVQYVSAKLDVRVQDRESGEVVGSAQGASLTESRRLDTALSLRVPSAAL